MKKEITIKVPAEFKERVEEECKRSRITEAELIMTAVEYLLNTKEMQS